VAPLAAPTVVVAALVEDSGALVLDSRVDGAREPRVFLARRSASAGHGGLWELPGGKVEPDEAGDEALRREIREELGVGLAVLGPPASYEVEIGGRAFVFLVFPARFVMEGCTGFALSAHDQWGYFEASELGALALAPFDGPALRDWAGGRIRSCTEGLS
jgi:8-oxo-dGTP diphosphatase